MIDDKLLLPEHKCRVIVEKREVTFQSSVERWLQITGELKPCEKKSFNGNQLGL